MIKEKVRPPAVAGLFYPDVPSILNAEIEKMFERSVDIVGDKKINGEIKGIIAPHAGYMYSGQTAAVAYSLLRGKSFDTVVVVSPSHREYFDGISVYDGRAYKTPLGEIEIDVDLAELIVERGNERPLRVVGLKATPMRGRGVVIEFSLTKPARIQAEVMTLTGRKVAVLDAPSGDGLTHRLMWRWTSGDGTKVGVGPYLIRILATDEDGRQVQAATVVKPK